MYTDRDLLMQLLISQTYVDPLTSGTHQSEIQIKIQTFSKNAFANVIYEITEIMLSNAVVLLLINAIIFVYFFLLLFIFVSNLAQDTIWGRFSIKMSSYRSRDPHIKDKTVSRPSYL